MLFYALSANHMPICFALRPTCCCNIDTTAISRWTEITHWQQSDCSQPAHRNSTKKAAYSVPNLAICITRLSWWMHFLKCCHHIQWNTVFKKIFPSKQNISQLFARQMHSPILTLWGEKAEQVVSLPLPLVSGEANIFATLWAADLRGR